MNQRIAGHWDAFSAAPHRMMFFSGVLQSLLVLLLWLAELLGRYTPAWAPLPLSIPSTAAHSLLMLYGVFPFFMFGFLMTTYPRWMRSQPIPRPRYLAAWSLLSAGLVLLYAGLFLTRWLVAAGVLLMVLGWGWAMAALFQCYRSAPARNKSYERYLNLALLAGGVGLLGYLGWLGSGSERWYLMGRELALWLFLVPVVVVVGHRMLPFFSSCVLRPYTVIQPRWSLPLMGLCVAGHLVVEILRVPAWRLLFDLPLAVMAVHHSLVWGLRRSFQIRLLAMLHLAFLVLGLAMLLYAVQSLALWFLPTPILGRAPLHLLVIGCITTLMLAMVSRVSLAHSGRPLEADWLTWGAYWGLMLAALLRAMAELPMLAAATPGLTLGAATLWLACLAPWGLRLLPMYVLPRVDGQPG